MANSEEPNRSEGKAPSAKDGVRREIAPRTFRFAARIVKLVAALPANRAGEVFARQLGRCGTSVGANVEEAQGSHSRAEFVRRMNIARSEARETLYWLRLIRETGCMPAARIAAIIEEAEELVRILVTIVKRARKVE